MRDCTKCPDKDYCIPDECEDLGAKKMPSRTAMRKGHIEKYPFKVYHIVKPKGNKTMIELKITVDKAVELEQEVKDLYQSIVGAPVKEVEPAKKEVPSLEATREAVKDVMAKAADKTKAKGEFKAFLDSIGAEKVTSATDEQRIQIMEWVNSRG